MAAIVGLRARSELGHHNLSAYVRELISIFADKKGYLHAAANFSASFRQNAESNRKESCNWGHILVADDFTSPDTLLKYSNYLIREFELRPEKSLLLIRGALSCLEGVRVMSSHSQQNSEQSFLTGKALLTAIEYTRSTNPIGWSDIYNSRSKTRMIDLAIAEARLESAEAQAVGAFRTLIRTYRERAVAFRT